MAQEQNHEHTADYRVRRGQAIETFVEAFAAGPDSDLLAQMLVTITRLARDQVDRGDLKLLTNALKELRYAFKVFAPYRHVRKVSIFGSSRTPPDHPEYLQADAFARLMRERNWMVITGAGDGIMGAGHVGAGAEASFGVAIRLPFEQKTNEIIAEDPKLVHFRYFFTRKLLFLKEASAIALFPGGFGTQDEGFEALTLIQTGKAELVPIVLVDAPGGTYWSRWRDYVVSDLLQRGMISPEDMDLFLLTDDPREAADHITRFYRRYHSARYVDDRLVVRINEPLPTAALTRLNERFTDILDSGQIEQLPGPLDGEEGHWPEKARLTLHFNRKDVGRLRQLIDALNAE
ncbi:MAG: LOG family protein [Phycisphaerales bacterium]|nr:LOG family protein [Phycisphaerales bacterium]